MSAEIEDATKRAALVWVEAAGRTQAMWHVWYDGAAWVVTGEGEQPDPGLAQARQAGVQVGRDLRWTAEVTPVEPGSAEWAAVVPLLIAGRLNLPDRDTAADRWAAGCRVYRLAPTAPPLN